MIKTEAIILKKADLGEVDQLLTIYSKEFGKIQVLAKGTKKLESKLRCHLESFSYSHLILIEGKSFRIVKDAILMDQFLPMRKNLEKIKIIYQIAKLIDELIVGEEKDEEIWNLLISAFRDKELNVKNFQDNLLKLLGYDPEHVKNLAEIY
jgi:DNA repair protein RecO (recombination protein O)